MKINKLVIGLMFMMLSVLAYGQDPNVSIYTDNGKYLSARIYEFDIIIKTTGSTSAFELRTFQAGLYMNGLWVNGGNITAQNSSTFTDMTTPGYNGVFQWNPIDNLLNCSVNFDVVDPSGCISTTVTSTPLLVTKIRITNSVDFSCSTPDIKFNYVSNMSPLRLRTTFSWRQVACTTNYDMFYPGRTYTGNARFNNEIYSSNDADGKSPVSGTVNDGFCQGQLTLTAFLQGYYSSGQLNAALYNGSIPHANLEQADTITIELRSTPTATSEATIKTILYTNGTAYCMFPLSLVGNSYWIIFKHRNAIETWSAAPVLLASRTSYDFTSGQNQAYGSNMVQTDDLIGWAFFSGDISDAGTGIVGAQDGVIESQDYGDMENAVNSIITGYVVEDITGDGVVESTDYSYMENNVSAIVFSNHP